MKVTVSPAQVEFDPMALKPGDLCLYDDEVCMKTGHAWGTLGCLVSIKYGEAYCGYDVFDVRPFHGTVLLDTEASE